MKKTFFLFLLFIFTEVSLAQKGLKLTCTVSDGSYFDTIEFYSDKKAALTSISNRNFDVLDVYIYPDSYLLSGEYTKGLATIRYTINRTTGKFETIIFWKGSKETITNGFCRKIENKF
jgi:hypothetical protein